MQTLTKMKAKLGRKSIGKNDQEESDNNKSFSAVKPMRLDFIEQNQQTAATLKFNMDFLNDSFTQKKSVFDEVLFSNESDNSP